MKMTYNLEDGDIIFVRPNTASTWYLWLFQRLIRFIDNCYYNHTQVYIQGYLYQANKKIERVSPLLNIGEQIQVWRLITPLSKEESNVILEIAKNDIGKSYDYMSALFYQLLYILTNRRIWLGRKGIKAENTYYCTEYVSHLYFKLFGFFPQHYKLAPNQLQKQMPFYFKVVFEGVLNR